MNTFDEFDEQTDFSFFTLEESAPVAVSPKKSRSVQTGKTNVGIKLTFTFSDKHKANISKAQTGRKDSPERVAKRSASNRGKKRSIEFCEHISKVRTGMKFSNEHKANLSKAQTGKKSPPEVVAKRAATFRERVANGTLIMSYSKSVMTPAGIFPSRGTAAKFFTVSCASIANWMKECPQQFYYITKD
jgi:hypothetical protein